MHEIVTLQIGEQANYLSTHFWNIQETYFTYDERRESLVDHDIHFRPGVAADGSDTYTPRTLIYDFKKNFGSLKKVNELYEVFEDPFDLPPTQAATYRLPQVHPHPYQQALNSGIDPPKIRSDSVRYWSDFNRVFYHPKSVVHVHEDMLNPRDKAFEDWNAGVELFDALQKDGDRMDDEVRPMIEECDQMQGFQVLAQVDNGWGGFASSYLERLRDEYSKSSIISWALHGFDHGSLSTKMLRETNRARSIVRMSEHTSLYIPMSASPTGTCPALDLSSQHPWCTSAVQAVALETMLLPTRVKGIARQTWPRLDDIVRAHSAQDDHKIAQLELEVLDVLGAGSAHANGASDLNEFDEQKEHIMKFLPFPKTMANEASRLSETAQTTRAHTDTECELMESPSGRHDLHKYRIDLALPILDSFPLPGDQASGKRIEALRTRSSFGTSSMIADWARSLATVVERQRSLRDREELVDGLQHVAMVHNGSESDDSCDDD